MDRFILKPFASSATNSGVFGSFMAGSPTTSTDPDTIQSLPAWDEGWASAVTLQGKFPKLEEMQGLQYVISKAVKELYKEGVPVWDADEDYYQYSIVSYTPTGDTAPKLYYNLTGTYTSTNPADDTTNWSELTTSGGGQGMPIGTIYALSCSAAYVPEGSLPLDGTQYTKAQFTQLWNNYLTGNDPLLLTCSYADYASDIATYGQCIKWAVDTVNETFKVPTIKDGSFIQQALSDSELGKCYKAGLPNITGTIWGENSNETVWSEVTGAFYKTNTSGKRGLGDLDSDDTNIGFDASRSSSVYGNSSTVQPEAVALRYFVVVANGEINESMMDWAAWASSLSGKLNTDGSNLGTGTGSGSVRAVVETYVNGTSWYRVYSDKWCEQGGKVIGTGDIQVSLLKPYANTNYSVVTTYTDTSSTESVNIKNISVWNITSTDFYLRTSGSSGFNKNWQASGYIS